MEIKTWNKKTGEHEKTEVKILNGHNNEKNAVVVNNYPYGYKKTKARFWIETTKNGDRFVKQTLNPKTQEWNKPKKSTYQDICFLVKRKDNRHINHIGYKADYSSLKELKQFKEKTKLDKQPLNELQKQKLKEITARLKTMEHVEYKITRGETVNLTDLMNGDPEAKAKAEKIKKQQEKHKKQEEKTRKQLNAIYNHYLNQENGK